MYHLDFFYIYAIGRRLQLCSYDKTAPIEILLALVSTMNVFSNAGNYRIGALVSLCFKVSNATGWSGPHS